MLLYFALCLLASWSCLPRMVSSMTREYYIAAVERNWNYAPSGQNKIKEYHLIRTGKVTGPLASNAECTGSKMKRVVLNRS